jgi:hypothetical protein
LDEDSAGITLFLTFPLNHLNWMCFLPSPI